MSAINILTGVAAFCVLLVVAQAQQNGDARLAIEVIPGYGIVEIFHTGGWYPVCSGQFDHNTATVVCRQLGYTSGVPRPVPNSFTRGGGQTYLLDSPRCMGNEDNILQCNHNGITFQTYCLASGGIAGVQCNGVEYDLPVRIEDDGQSSLAAAQGYLQVFHNGEWHYFCYPENSNNAGAELYVADVACRMNGYGMADAYYGSGLAGGAPTGPYADFTIRCMSGREQDLSKCAISPRPAGSQCRIVGAICDIPSPYGCATGAYGPDCNVCPIGKYQFQRMQASCNDCPTGTTTAQTGTVSVVDCIVAEPSVDDHPDVVRVKAELNTEGTNTITALTQFDQCMGHLELQELDNALSKELKDLEDAARAEGNDDLANKFVDLKAKELVIRRNTNHAWRTSGNQVVQKAQLQEEIQEILNDL